MANKEGEKAGMVGKRRNKEAGRAWGEETTEWMRGRAPSAGGMAGGERDGSGWTFAMRKMRLEDGSGGGRSTLVGARV